MTRKLTTGALALLAFASFVIALVPAWRGTVLARLTPGSREVLAVVEGDVLNDGKPAKVIKLREGTGLYVEVVREAADGTSVLVERLTLPDRHDGLINVRGQVTRLAVLDLDGDGRNELVAPSFDNQLVPHLNVFRYTPALARFTPVGPQAE